MIVQSIDITPIVPEIFITLSAMILLLLGAFRNSDKATEYIFNVSIIVFALTIWQIMSYSGGYGSVINGLVVLDNFAIFTKVIILASSAVVLVLASDYYKFSRTVKPIAEFPVLVMLATVGMMIMVSANDLMTLYVGLELQSLSLYVLAALHRDNEKASEAGLKYFILGALASGLLLYGISLIYGFTGQTGFTELSELYRSDIAGALPDGALVGMILLITGLCFKISAVPFHMWTPDTYQGVPKSVTVFFASAPKIAAVALFVRVLMQAYGGVVEQWQQVIIVISVITMYVGALGALKQTNIKRLMAYSSIGHMGFVLVGLAAGTQVGAQSVLVYMSIYATMSLGTFAAIMLMQRRGEHVEEISDLSGLAKERPVFAAVIAILMLSMAGIPPLAGFFGKLMVFSAAVDAGLLVLAILGVLSSVIAAFYYLKIIKIMYFDTADQPLDNEISSRLKIVLGISALFNLLYFVMPTPLLNAAKTAAGSLF